jgi:hypothetical protein
MRLAGSRGRYPYHRGRHLKVLVDLFVYADESGTHKGATMCLVAGHIGSPRQWDRFNVRWRSVLASEEVDELHAKDFFQHAHWRSLQSPYHGWTASRADAFLVRLLEVVSVSRIMPIGCAVSLADFESQPQEMRQFLTGAKGLAYFGADGSVTTSLKGGAPARPYQSAWLFLIFDALLQVHAKEVKVHFAFDEQHDYEGLVQQAYASLRKTLAAPWADQLGGISYENSRDYPGIQLADLYCYLMGAGLVHPEKLTPPQWSALRVLLNRRREGIRVQTNEAIVEIARRLDEKILADLRQRIAQSTDLAGS